MVYRGTFGPIDPPYLAPYLAVGNAFQPVSVSFVVSAFVGTYYTLTVRYHYTTYKDNFNFVDRFTMKFCGL